jgi:hypothetical protein
MHSRDLNRAVARATGEAVREIALRGFVLLTCGPVEREPQDDAGDADECGWSSVPYRDVPEPVLAY